MFSCILSYCLDKMAEIDNREFTWTCEFCDRRVVQQSGYSEISRSPDVELLQSTKPFDNIQDAEHPPCPLICEEAHIARNGISDPSTNESKSLYRDVEKKHNPVKQLHYILEDKHSPDKLSDATCVEGPHSDSQERALKLTLEEDFSDAVQPLPDPTWMGSFRIFGEYSCTVNEMLAHMSNEACKEASAVGNSLPVLLSLHAVPKSNVWPLKFKRMGPVAKHIAVYFFPESCRAERVYDRLVDDIIEHQLAMIAKVDEIELLVFSSLELPSDNWRIQRKYYLWGMFRRKKKTFEKQGGDDPSRQLGSSNSTWPSNLTAESGDKVKGSNTDNCGSSSPDTDERLNTSVSCS